MYGPVQKWSPDSNSLSTILPTQPFYTRNTNESISKPLRIFQLHLNDVDLAISTCYQVALDCC